MSVLANEYLKRAVPCHLDVMGDCVIYSPANGAVPRPITVEAVQMHGAIVEGAAHETKQDVLQVFCRADARCGIVNPAEGDVLHWGRVDWTFARTISGDGKTWVLQFERVKITQFGHNKPATI